MPDHRQKKLAKQKKKRANVSRAGQRTTDDAAEAQFLRRLGNLAKEMPIGPCYITRWWQDPKFPRVHQLVVTRHMDASTIVAASFLLDLGSEGVRDAIYMRPMSLDELEDVLEKRAMESGVPYEPITSGKASALVRRLIDYGIQNGIRPPKGIDPMLQALDDNPDPTLQVEFGRNGRPLFTPHNTDDGSLALRSLFATVGPDGFDIDENPRVPEGWR